MVDPITDDDRRQTLRWARVGVVLLVGLSAGMISIQGGAPLELVSVTVLVGLIVGGALVWYLFPSAEDIAPAGGHRYRR
ncbi:MAG: hypothetical protein RI560_07150 [Natronomonas sp.]|uniref:hypothetical protein n=1 Tax=Natronomonas sp. TaxID=2184060 RepID=UPI0028709D8C|nr:hypothetical protein [Natronomonas sp.]MDR9381432.1 hypothetical protein [Natronomonas sp.]MDR9430670.1 hypothetical protein [Natronomonas sp.]